MVPAARISLQPADIGTIDKDVWPDVIRILATNMKTGIFNVNNVISIDFFNKKFVFTIREITPQAIGDELSNLIDKFESMEITKEKSYFVTNSTNLEFYEKINESEDTGRESIKVLKIEQIGGMNEIIAQLKDNLNISLSHQKSSTNFFVPRSVLLSGQNGSGKTLLCDAIIESCDALVMKITATEIFSKYFGETEAKLMSYFERAFKNYPNPSIIVIEEISSICPKETKEETAKRVQMAFLNILDDIHVRKEASRLFLITTTSNIDGVNLAVRRYGRLDVEIEIPVPDPIAREQILLKQLQRVKHNLAMDDIKTVADNSHGFIASDLSNLVAKAALHASSKDLSIDSLITLNDIQFAFGQVVPSAMKEVVIKCPNVKWSDIGGQDELKLQLKQAIEWPLLHPETFTRLGMCAQTTSKEFTLYILIFFIHFYLQALLHLVGF